MIGKIIAFITGLWALWRSVFNKPDPDITRRDADVEAAADARIDDLREQVEQAETPEAGADRVSEALDWYFRESK